MEWYEVFLLTAVNVTADLFVRSVASEVRGTGTICYHLWPFVMRPTSIPFQVFFRVIMRSFQRLESISISVKALAWSFLFGRHVLHTVSHIPAVWLCFVCSTSYTPGACLAFSCRNSHMPSPK